jgi:hypothetical protein
MRDWQRAQEKLREWEAEDRRTTRPTLKPTEDAWTEFLADIEARKLHSSTIRKYKLLQRQMEGFAKDHGLRFLTDFKEEMPSDGAQNGRRIRGLVLLLRYSGICIGDAVNFSTDQLAGNRFFDTHGKPGLQ